MSTVTLADMRNGSKISIAKGERTKVKVDMGDSYALLDENGNLVEDVEKKREGDDLVVTTPDGAEVVFENYYAACQGECNALINIAQGNDLGSLGTAPEAMRAEEIGGAANYPQDSMGAPTPDYFVRDTAPNSSQGSYSWFLPTMGGILMAGLGFGAGAAGGRPVAQGDPKKVWQNWHDLDNGDGDHGADDDQHGGDGHGGDGHGGLDGKDGYVTLEIRQEGGTFVAWLKDKNGGGKKAEDAEWFVDGHAALDSDGKPIKGGSYKPVPEDEGKKLGAKATIVDSNGNRKEIESGDVTIGDVDAPGEATITRPNGGDKLVCVLTDPDGVDGKSVKAEWYRDGKLVTKADGSPLDGLEYPIGKADKGKNISVKVTYRDLDNHDGVARSVDDFHVDGGAPSQGNTKGSAKITRSGDELVASIDDADGIANAKPVYKWLRDGKPLTDAQGNEVTGQRYTPSKADRGHEISVNATWKDDAGNKEDVFSNAVRIEKPQNNPGSLAIKKSGSNLLAEVVDDDGVDKATLVVKWFRDGKPITDGQGNQITGASYVITKADKGHGVNAKATWTDKEGNSEAAESNSIALPKDPNNPGSVSIKMDGADIVAEVRDGDGVDKGTLVIKWMRDGKPITDAQGNEITGERYTVAKEDKGHKISAHASWTDKEGNSEKADSNELDLPKPANRTGFVTIHADGGNIVAEVEDPDGIENGTLSIKWLRDGKPITDAQGNQVTGASYAITKDDKGHSVSAKATWTDKAGNSEDTESNSVALPKDQNNPGSVSIKMDGGDIVAEVRDGDGVDKGTLVVKWLKDGKPITDAQGNDVVGERYTVANADKGHKISAHASWTDNEGNSEKADSNELDLPKPANQTGFVTIHADGGNIVAEVEDPDGIENGTLSIKWLRDGKPITDANGREVEGASYAITKADKGHSVRAKATWTDKAGNSEDVESNSVVLPKDQNNPGSVSIRTDGADIVAEVQDGDGVDKGTLVVKWLRDGKPITDAQGNEVVGERYTVANSDKGHKISAHASWTDNEGNLESADSNHITPPDDTNHQGHVTIKMEDDKITAEVRDPDGIDMDTLAIRWLRDGSPILDAGGKPVEGESYVLTKDDNGHKITAEATWTDRLGNGESHVSNQVIPARFRNVPGLARIALEGGELVASIEDDDGTANAKPAYKWFRDGDPIVGPDGGQVVGERYTITKEDKGRSITAHASWIDDKGNGEFAISNSITPSKDGNSPGSVSISWYGNALLATINDEDGVENATPMFKWSIDGEPADKYHLYSKDRLVFFKNDRGRVVTVKAFWIDDAGNIESAESGTFIPDIQNSPGLVHLMRDGDVLKVAIEDRDGTAWAKPRHEWFRDGVPMVDSKGDPVTGSSHTITDADRGHEITVQSSWTDDMGNDESWLSNPIGIDVPPNRPGFAVLHYTDGVLKVETRDDDGLLNARPVYTWYAGHEVIKDGNGVPVNGDTLRPTKELEGELVHVDVEWTDDLGHREFVHTNYSSFPDVMGDNGRVFLLREGDTLRAMVEDSDGIAQGPEFKWESLPTMGGGIKDLKGDTYKLTEEDKGLTFRVSAKWVDSEGSFNFGSSQDIFIPEDPNIPGEFRVVLDGENIKFFVHDDDGVHPYGASVGMYKNGVEYNSKTVPADEETIYAITESERGEDITFKASWKDGKGHRETHFGMLSVPKSQENHPGSVTIARHGDTLKATISDEDGLNTSKQSFVWLRDGEVIVNDDGTLEIGQIYAIKDVDRGHKISVRAEWTDGLWKQEKGVSNAVDIPDNEKGWVALAMEGGFVKATVVDGDGVENANPSFLWYRNGQPILGSDGGQLEGSSYQIANDDKNVWISASAKWTDDKGNSEEAQSVPIRIPSDVAYDINEPLEASIKISREGAMEVLVTDNDGLDESTIKVEWLKNGTPIKRNGQSVTGMRFEPGEDELDSMISARVEHTDKKGHRESVVTKEVMAAGNLVDFNNQGNLSISWSDEKGDEKVEHLRAVVRDEDGLIPSTVKFVWLADGKKITDDGIGRANGEYFYLGANANGHVITCEASYFDNLEHFEKLVSKNEYIVPKEGKDYSKPNLPGEVFMAFDPESMLLYVKELKDPDGISDKSSINYKWYIQDVPVVDENGAFVNSDRLLVKANWERWIPKVVVSYVDDKNNNEVVEKVGRGVHMKGIHEEPVALIKLDDSGKFLVADIKNLDKDRDNDISFLKFTWFVDGQRVPDSDSTRLEIDASWEGKTVQCELARMTRQGRREVILSPEVKLPTQGGDFDFPLQTWLERDASGHPVLRTYHPDKVESVVSQKWYKDGEYAGDAPLASFDSKCEVDAEVEVQLANGKRLSGKTGKLTCYSDKPHVAQDTYDELTIIERDGSKYAVVEHHGEPLEPGASPTVGLYHNGSYLNSVEYHGRAEFNIDGMHGEIHALVEGRASGVSYRANTNVVHLDPNRMDNPAVAEIIAGSYSGRPALEVDCADADGLPTNNVKWYLLDDDGSKKLLGSLKFNESLFLNEYFLGKDVVAAFTSIDGMGNHCSVVTKPHRVEAKDFDSPGSLELETVEHGDGITIKALLADPDGIVEDRSNLRIKWYRDGALVKESSGHSNDGTTLEIGNEQRGDKYVARAEYVDARGFEGWAISHALVVPTTSAPGILEVREEQGKYKAVLSDEDGFDPGKVEWTWFRDGVPIRTMVGEDGTAYEPTSLDAGRIIEVEAKYVDRGMAPDEQKVKSEPLPCFPERFVKFETVNDYFIPVIHDKNGYDKENVTYRWYVDGRIKRVRVEDRLVEYDDDNLAINYSEAYAKIDVEVSYVDKLGDRHVLKSGGQSYHDLHPASETADGEVFFEQKGNVLQAYWKNPHGGGFHAFNFNWYKDGAPILDNLGKPLAAPAIPLDPSDEGSVYTVSGNDSYGFINNPVEGSHVVAHGSVPRGNSRGKVTISVDGRIMEAKVEDPDGVSNGDQVFVWFDHGEKEMFHNYSGLNNFQYFNAKTSSFKLNPTEFHVVALYMDDKGNYETAYSDVLKINKQSSNPGAAVIYENAGVLEARVGDLNGTQFADFTYEWLRDGQPIAGAEEGTYKIQSMDRGHAITVKVSYVDDAGFPKNVTSHAFDVLPDGSYRPNHEPWLDFTRVGDDLYAYKVEPSTDEIISKSAVWWGVDGKYALTASDIAARVQTGGAWDGHEVSIGIGSGYVDDFEMTKYLPSEKFEKEALAKSEVQITSVAGGDSKYMIGEGDMRIAGLVRGDARDGLAVEFMGKTYTGSDIEFQTLANGNYYWVLNIDPKVFGDYPREGKTYAVEARANGDVSHGICRVYYSLGDLIPESCARQTKGNEHLLVDRADPEKVTKALYEYEKGGEGNFVITGVTHDYENGDKILVTFDRFTHLAKVDGTTWSVEIPGWQMANAHGIREEASSCVVKARLVGQDGLLKGVGRTSLWMDPRADIEMDVVSGNNVLTRAEADSLVLSGKTKLVEAGATVEISIANPLGYNGVDEMLPKESIKAQVKADGTWSVPIGSDYAAVLKAIPDAKLEFVAKVDDGGRKAMAQKMVSISDDAQADSFKVLDSSLSINESMKNTAVLDRVERSWRAYDYGQLWDEHDFSKGIPYDLVRYPGSELLERYATATNMYRSFNGLQPVTVGGDNYQFMLQQKGAMAMANYNCFGDNPEDWGVNDPEAYTHTSIGEGDTQIHGYMDDYSYGEAKDRMNVLSPGNSEMYLGYSRGRINQFSNIKETLSFKEDDDQGGQVPFVAWPSPGYFPMGHLPSKTWNIHVKDGIKFDEATVKINIIRKTSKGAEVIEVLEFEQAQRPVSNQTGMFYGKENNLLIYVDPEKIKHHVNNAEAVVDCEVVVEAGADSLKYDVLLFNEQAYKNSDEYLQSRSSNDAPGGEHYGIDDAWNEEGRATITINGREVEIGSKELVQIAKISKEVYGGQSGHEEAGDGKGDEVEALDLVNMRMEFGQNDDVLVVKGGYRNSTVMMGDGNDRVVLSDYQSGMVDGGEGFDSLELDVAASESGEVSLSHFTGFENILLSGQQNQPTGSVLALDLEGILSNHDSDGILRISGTSKDKLKVEDGEITKVGQSFKENGVEKVKLLYETEGGDFTIHMDMTMYQNGAGII